MSHPEVWPSPKAATMRAIADEIKRARQRFPERVPTTLFDDYQAQAQLILQAHHAGSFNAFSVWAAWVKVAALAVRIIEEGALEFAYGERGYEPAPDNGPLFEPLKVSSEAQEMVDKMRDNFYSSRTYVENVVGNPLRPVEAQGPKSYDEETCRREEGCAFKMRVWPCPCGRQSALS